MHQPDIDGERRLRLLLHSLNLSNNGNWGDNPARFREQPAEPTSSEMDAFWHINGRLCCRCPYFSQKSMKTTTHPDGFFHANRLHPRAFREAAGPRPYALSCYCIGPSPGLTGAADQ